MPAVGFTMAALIASHLRMQLAFATIAAVQRHSGRWAEALKGVLAGGLRVVIQRS
jgi:hypothetical protein